MDNEKKSFIMYFEWIDDLPEEYQQKFLIYIYRYARFNEIPQIEGLEKSLWVKIQRRMEEDFESWSETKKARAEAGKKSGQVRKNKKEQNGQMFNLLNKKEQNEQEGTKRTVSVSVYESVYDNVSDYVSDNVGDNADSTDSEADFLTEKTDSEADSFTSDDLTHFDLIKPSSCYCCNSQMAKAFLTKDTKHIYSKCFKCGVYYYADKKENKWKVGSERK